MHSCQLSARQLFVDSASCKQKARFSTSRGCKGLGKTAITKHMTVDMAWLPKNLRKKVQCSLCHETICNPKGLPCDHSFCCECLQKLAATRKKRRFTTIECPECRVVVEIPEGGSFEAFPTSRSRNVLLDLLAAGADDCETERSFEECSSCDVKQIEYRCEKCRLRIRVKCVIESPSKNDSRASQARAEYKDEIKHMLNTMEEKISDYETDLKRDNNKFRTTEKKIHTAKKKIGKTVDELVRSLRMREAKLMEHLDSLYTFNQQEHLIRKESFELNLSLMRGMVEYAENILGKEALSTPPIETQI